MMEQKKQTARTMLNPVRKKMKMLQNQVLGLIQAGQMPWQKSLTKRLLKASPSSSPKIKSWRRRRKS